MKLTGSDVDAMRIELGDEAVAALARGETTLPDLLLKKAFVAGFEHGADRSQPGEDPAWSEQERRAFRAGAVEGTAVARDGLLDEVTRSGYRSVAIEDEFRVWLEGETEGE